MTARITPSVGYPRHPDSGVAIGIRDVFPHHVGFAGLGGALFPRGPLYEQTLPQPGLGFGPGGENSNEYCSDIYITYIYI